MKTKINKGWLAAFAICATLVGFSTGSAADLNAQGDYQITGSVINVDPVYTLSNTNIDALVPSNDIATTKGFAVKAAYAATDDLVVSGTMTNYKQKSNWEANIGLAYKVLNNLTYEVHLGYIDAGENFEAKDSQTTAEDITVISHNITLKF